MHSLPVSCIVEVVLLLNFAKVTVDIGPVISWVLSHNATLRSTGQLMGHMQLSSKREAY